MSDWTAGYVVDRDTAYTYGYYAELSPLRARFSFLQNGLLPPKFETACELGFGQGLSVNFHATASTTRWWGTDFNPSQASFAQEMASASGAGAQLVDESFAEFCSRDDLPAFDYIGLHGIWSWISDENRLLLVDFIRRKLNVGGVLYISYNTLPGWASFAPMRHLFSQHAEVLAAPGRGIISRIDAATEFATKLLALNPRYALANPHIGERLKQLTGQNRHYLAHEYFNQWWSPVYFSDMEDSLRPAKLDYACSAHPLDSMQVTMNEAQRAFLAEIPDRMFRETVRDFIFNQQFRRDYWVRGVRNQTRLANTEAVRRERFVLLQKPSDVSLKITTPMGDANLQEAVYRPIVETMAQLGPATFADIEEALARTRRLSLGQVAEALAILISTGAVSAAQSEEEIAAVRPRTQSLNKYLMERARTGTEVTYLASPVTGGAIGASPMEQLFLLARSQGLPQQQWVQFAWRVLNVQGQRIIKDGKVLETPEQNLAEIETHLREFVQKRLGIMETLQVA